MSEPQPAAPTESSAAAQSLAPSAHDAADHKPDTVTVYDIQFDASTGDLVGYASLLTDSKAVLHRSARRAVLLRKPGSQLRLRLQVPGGPHGLAVYDGTAVVGELDDGPAVAVELDRPATGAVLPHLDTSPDAPVSIQTQVGRYIRDQAANDPPAPPYPPPARYRIAPGLLYWFCKAFPSASCC